MLRIAVIAYLFFYGIMSFAQSCDTLFNFNNWSMKGNPDGNWEILGNNKIINTSYIFPPTLLVDNQDIINVKIEGVISVETATDANFIGLVFGYKQPMGIGTDNNYNFYLFDWKANSATVGGYKAYEGFRLSHYNGKINETEIKKYFWGTTDEPPKRNLIKTNYGDTLGWKPFEKYHFELLYTSNKISI